MRRLGTLETSRDATCRDRNDVASFACKKMSACKDRTELINIVETYMSKSDKNGSSADRVHDDVPTQPLGLLATAGCMVNWPTTIIATYQELPT